MNYIQKVIEHIQTQAPLLDIQQHQLGSIFNVSESKLQKDFRAQTGTTIRQKIIQHKLHYALKIKGEQPGITLSTLLEKITWTHSPRAFNRAYKKQYHNSLFHNTGKTSNASHWIDNDHYVTFMRNSELLDLLLFRFVLATEKYVVTHHAIGHKTYTIQANNPLLQSSFLPLDKVLVFDLWLDIEKPNKMQVEMYLKRYNQEKTLYKINNLAPYIFMIDNISAYYQDHPKLNVINAIQNWQVLLNEQEAIRNSSLIPAIPPITFHETTLVELDLDAYFIKYTQNHLNQITDTFTRQTDEQLTKYLNFNLNALLGFMMICRGGVNTGISICSREMLRENRLSKLRQEQRLDLLLSIVEIPYLESLDLRSYTFQFDRKLIKSILKLVNHKHLPEFLKDFKIQIELRHNDDDTFNNEDTSEDENINNSVLIDLLNTYISKAKE